MLKNYLIVSLVVVGSIMITPSFLTKSKFTFVSVTEELSTPDVEQQPSEGIEETLQLEIDRYTTNTPTAINVSQKFL
jgi:hypothetical protein